jgi:prepilin-type N-terminal cleavage/methylation domain-containing protein
VTGRRGRRDDGMTLVEVLVAIGLFAVLGTLVLSVGIATARVTDDTTGAVDLNEEARVAFERLARDLRDAALITEVMPAPASAGCGSDGFTGVSFEEGSRSAADVPHDVAYRWSSADKRLILSEAIPDPEEQPILAAKVTRFCVHLWSSRWSPLPEHPELGSSWSELDPAAPAPNTQGWWCPAQLAEIDRVTVSMTASLDGHERDYESDVFLRNADVEGTDVHPC